jgi:hypothetical protein
LAQQQEGNDLPDQCERKEFAPQSRSRSRPHLACKRARQQHRRRRDADTREGEIERIESARSDLDQKKGRTPQERQKGQRRIGRHGVLEDLEEAVPALCGVGI